jgi:hypothetical protein
MHIRATSRGKRFFEKFLKKLVEENVKNDQKALDLMHMDVVYKHDCNWVARSNPVWKNTFMAEKYDTSTPQHPSFCIYSGE